MRQMDCVAGGALICEDILSSRRIIYSLSPATFIRTRVCGNTLSRSPGEKDLHRQAC